MTTKLLREMRIRWDLLADWIQSDHPAAAVSMRIMSADLDILLDQLDGEERRNPPPPACAPESAGDIRAALNCIDTRVKSLREHMTTDAGQVRTDLFVIEGSVKHLRNITLGGVSK